MSGAVARESMGDRTAAAAGIRTVVGARIRWRRPLLLARPAACPTAAHDRPNQFAV
jgi:hypothetical protein